MRRTLLWLVLALVAAGCASAADARPRCRDEGSAALVLMAQAVPDAAYLPCVGELPEGWMMEDVEVTRGRAEMRIVVDQMTGGGSRIAVTLSPSCPPAEGAERDSGIDAVRRVDTIAEGARGHEIATRTYRFAGGCVLERFDLAPRKRGEVLGRAWALLGLVPAEDVRAEVEATYGRPLR